MAGPLFADDKYVTSTVVGGKVGLDINIAGGVAVAASSDIDQIDGNPVDVGNGTAGTGTLRVAIASNNSPLAVTGPLTDAQLRATAVPISGTVTSTPSGLQSVNLTQVGSVAFAQGTRVAASSISMTVASDEVVPLGQATKAASIPVVEATSATGTVTSVADSASSVTLLTANAARTIATIHNDSDAILYLKLGATASLTSFTLAMAAFSYYEVPGKYSGIIDGIWEVNTTGSARITEIS